MNFKLKTPNSKNESLILFYANLKNGERFVYSIGERIHPQYWDKRNQYPKKSKPQFSRLLIKKKYSTLEGLVSLLNCLKVRR